MKNDDNKIKDVKSTVKMKYITNARAGNGFARIGSALVPFYNQMNKNSEIYKLMSTKPEDFLKSEELL